MCPRATASMVHETAPGFIAAAARRMASRTTVNPRRTSAGAHGLALPRDVPRALQIRAVPVDLHAEVDVEDVTARDPPRRRAEVRAGVVGPGEHGRAVVRAPGEFEAACAHVLQDEVRHVLLGLARRQEPGDLVVDRERVPMAFLMRATSAGVLRPRSAEITGSDDTRRPACGVPSRYCINCRYMPCVRPSAITESIE